jgi:serine/threonine protein kinase/Flp pilus assembly protein TadD
MIGKTVSHYKILEKLGGGGMGVVYEGQDTKLDRKVALKFLSAHLGQVEEEKKRFIHEAKAASALDHPNICTIYEIDETEDGQMFIAMAYYDGETLKKKIERGPLNQDEAIGIAIQIGHGLIKAHEQGIVHRDIKPANIFMTKDGLVKILDFGLAKLAGHTKLTKADSTLGTVAYMSPEQTRGDELDHRTDIWSLGVILYEMLSGKFPFKGDYDQAVIYSISNAVPEPLTGLRTGIPVELEKIVNKCLEKDNSLRYQHSDDLIADLRRVKRDTDSVTLSHISETQPIVAADTQKIPFKRKLLIGLASLVGAAILTVAILLLIPRDKTIDSLAILPFINASGQEDTEWLSDGIPESIISSLQNIPNLRVTSFQSLLRQYEGNVPAVDDVRRDFDVKSVVMGRMTLRGDDVTINIEIVDTRDKSVILTHEYIENLANLFNIRSQISRDITEKLSLELSGKVERKVFPLKPPDHEAYQNYLRGRHFQYKRTPRDLKTAIQYFQKAIETDPEYALAFSGLADTYRLMRQYAGASRHSIQPKIRAAAEKALELNETLAEAHTSMGGALMNEQKYLDARKEFERAIELNPNYLLAYHWGALNLGYMGIFEDDIALAEKALELDPRSPIISNNLAYDYLNTGHLDKAIEECEKNMRLNPDHPTPYFSYAGVLSRIGEHKKAIEMGLKGMAIDSLSLVSNRDMADIYRLAGMYDQAIGVHQRMMTHNPELTRPALLSIGYIYRHKGDFNKAIEYYEKALAMDPIDVDAYGYLRNLYIIAGEYEESIEISKKIIDLEPERPSNYRRYGQALGIIGDHERAIEQYQKAVELNPVDLDYLGWAYFHARDFDRAVENLKKALDVAPNNVPAADVLANIYLYNDNFIEGVAYAKKSYDMVKFPNRNEIYKRAFPDGIIDERSTKDYYRGIMKEVNKKKDPGFPLLALAMWYAFIDEKDSVFVVLNKLYDTQNTSLALWIQCAFFDKFRSDPRYDASIKKLKLEKYIKPLE